LSPVQRQMSVAVEVVGLRAVGRGRLRVVAEPDRAVGHRLVDDDAGAVVKDLGDVAQRAQVVLGHLELAEGDGREVRVLAVGGEDPRVVGVAGAEPAGVCDRPQRGRELLALVGPADLQIRGCLRGVGQVLLAPVNGVLQQAIAWERHLRPLRELVARGDLGREGARGILEGGSDLAARLAQALVGAGHGHPQGLARAGRHGHLVAQLAAGALAERPVVADARQRRRVIGGAHGAGPRAAVGAAARGRLAGDRVLIGGNERRVVVRRRPREGAVVGELQRRACERALVGDVVARVRRHAGEAPRVGAHELGVRVDLDRDRLVRRARVGQLQAEERRPARVGRDVGALELQPAGVGEVVARVAPATRELRRLADPLVVDAEPDAVDQLQRRRPHAAHLAGDVPAVGVEPSVLEALDVGALTSRDLAAILQPIVGRQLRRGRLGGADTDKGDSERRCQSTSDTHRFTSVVGQSPRGIHTPRCGGQPTTMLGRRP
jgi:hypothetical protein